MSKILDVKRFFSARYVVTEEERPGERFRVANTCLDWLKRIVSWIYSPRSYKDENRRAISCFRIYATASLGADRLKRICTRYSIDLEKMERKGSPLLSRQIAQIVIGAKDVRVEDINDLILKANREGENWPFWISEALKESLIGYNTFCELDSKTFAECYKALSKPFADEWEVPPITERISGRATDWFARIFYDPFLADRERIQICEEHCNDTREVFMHNMVARVIKRDMDVGTLIPACNHSTGRFQYYYISAKVVSGEGMVSYVIHPATTDTDLKPIRFFRGSAFRSAEIDGISTAVTDLEKNLGKRAYESGKQYDPFIEANLPPVEVEAGHSLGATLIQYRIANGKYLQEAFLFNGPGIPLEEVEKFNNRAEKEGKLLNLIIRKSTKDSLCNLGQVHLGYKAPPHINVDFLKYYWQEAPKWSNAHVHVWGRDKLMHGIEGGQSRESVNQELDHRNFFGEKVRRWVGPFFSSILRSIRSVTRRSCSSRALQEQGLQMGLLEKGRWTVHRIRPLTVLA